jgi:hypothetical protein
VKHLKHPATIIAALALFLALGGSAAAVATGLIPGSKIKNHSIAAKKLTKGAIKTLHGLRGPKGATGAAGATGPQGPGGKILSYNATAVVGSPAPKTIGTLIGDTFGATCVSSSGDAELAVYLKTTDGSWSVDYSYLSYIGGAGSSYINSLTFPAGTLNTLLAVDNVTAASGTNQSDRQLDFVQIKPSPGSLIWHERAQTTSAPSATCHLSIQAFPEPLTAVAGTVHATAARPHLPIRLGPR